VLDQREKKITQPAIWMFILVALGTALPFLGVGGFDFITWDDPETLTQNEHVNGGLSKEGIHYAFTSAELNLWHPLTWISHQLDVSLFGLNPMWHHFMNLMIHVLSAIALFGALHALTGRRWSSLAVALLFGIHPLHVESVAWISERKDTLSGLFAHLTLWCYAIYAIYEKQNVKASRKRRWYVLALVMFSLGLLSKPSLVVWPLVLLLCDFWPLYRFSNRTEFFRCSREKIPFLILAGIVAYTTISLQGSRDDLGVINSIPLDQRLLGGMVNYGTYIQRIFWPQDLCYFYPARNVLEIGEIVIGVVILAIALSLAWYARRRARWMTWGILFFLGVLFPVIGFVVSGESVAPDRYSYLSATGVFIVVVWGCHALALRMRNGQRIVSTSIGLVIIILGTLSWKQAGYWRSTETLARHALHVNENNYHANNMYGVTLLEENPVTARSHFEAVLSLRPDHRYAHFNIGKTWQEVGDIPRARAAYSAQLIHWPKSADALHALGDLEMSEQRYLEAITYFEKLRDSNKKMGTALNGWATAHAKLKQWELAATGYTDLLKYRPNDSSVYANLGLSYLQLGRKKEAQTAFERALSLDPGNILAKAGLRQTQP